jgi:hypothetical protein
MLADGRNEAVAYQPLTTGNYRVRVTAEGNASGDYILDRQTKSAYLSLTRLASNSPVGEGSSATLRGIYIDPDPASSQVITIDWGRGAGPAHPSEGVTTLTSGGPNPPGMAVIDLGAGVWQFIATHAYIDDAPAGTATAVYDVGVTIKNNHQISVHSSTTIDVSNVLPSAAIMIPANPLLVEGHTVLLQGAASDPGGVSEQLTFDWKIYKVGFSVPFASGGNSSSFSFTPDNDGDYRIELTVSDDDGGIGTATQTISIVDAAAVANSFSAAALEDTPLTIPLQITESPADLANLGYLIVTPPQHGTLSGVMPDVIYLPAANYNGPDSFTYKVGDGKTFGNPATVSLSVAAVNDAPTFTNISGNYSALDENPATKGPALKQTIAGWAANLSAGPSDETGQSLNFIVTNDNNGLFAVQPAVGLNGTLTFTPLPNAHGIAHVSVVLRDNGTAANLSTPALFNIEIKKPHPLHNAIELGKRNGLDVTGATTAAPDGVIAANDVVAVINYINARGSGLIQSNVAPGPPYCDVTDDDQVGADDVIQVINYINAHLGESEAAESALMSATDFVVSSLALDATMNVAAETANESLYCGASAGEKSTTSVACSTTPNDLINLLAAEVATGAIKQRRREWRDY